MMLFLYNSFSGCLTSSSMTLSLSGLSFPYPSQLSLTKNFTSMFPGGGAIQSTDVHLFGNLSGPQVKAIHHWVHRALNVL